VLSVALVAPFAAIQAQEKIDPATAPVVNEAIRAANQQKNHDILDSTAAAFESTRKYDAAQTLLENSLTLRGQTSGDHSSAYAVGLMKLGALAEKRNKSADALDFYTRAVALGDTTETAPGLVYLASHALDSGDRVAAASLVDRALAVSPAGALSGRAASVKGDIALANGLPGVAESQYLQALSQEPADSPEAMATARQYARLLTSQNRSLEAEAMLQRANPTTPEFVVRSRMTQLAGDGVFRIGNGISPPVLLYKKEPEYTQEARAAKLQGTVVLYVQVTPDGHATNMKVMKSLGLGMDEKAMECVSQWKFSPGLKNGVAVTVEATVEVNFRLL
jgi:TonB family protein